MQLLDKQALRSLLPDEDRLRFDDIPPHYLTDALDRVHGQADALAFPLTTEEVSALLRYAHDQTGIGKGRQAAAMIRYGLLSGYLPIFFTDRYTLFSDMYRDCKALPVGGINLSWSI